MRIGVIGTGRIGSALGEAWTRAGHNVMYGSRNPDGNPDLANVSTVVDATQHGEVLLFAIPGAALQGTVKSLSLDGKTIIDATNGGGTPDELARTIPGATVYKAFNTLGFENFREPQFGDEHADLLYIGPETQRTPIEQLIRDVGLNPVYVGGLEEIGTLDAATRFWFALSKRFGRHTAYKVLSDTSA
jgi:8-hydroxy-5-deazaflavin:NADPH oxidoreductase